MSRADSATDLGIPDEVSHFQVKIPSDSNNKSLLKSINIMSFLSRIHSVSGSWGSVHIVTYRLKLRVSCHRYACYNSWSTHWTGERHGWFTGYYIWRYSIISLWLFQDSTMLYLVICSVSYVHRSASAVISPLLLTGILQFVRRWL